MFIKVANADKFNRQKPVENEFVIFHEVIFKSQISQVSNSIGL